MTALAASYQRTRFEGRAPLVVAHPIKAAVIIYAGAIVCRQAADNLVIPGTDTAGLVPQGVAMDTLDNSAGAAGTYGPPAERVIRVDHQGVWSFAIGATTPKAGDAAYILDDNKVGVAADATNDIKVGEFLRPTNDGSGQWLVDFSRR